MPISITRKLLVHAAGALLCLSSLGAQADNYRNIENYLSEYQQMAAFDGVVLIAESGEVVWQKAFGFADYQDERPMGTASRFRIASLSKQVTQAAIGRLADDGKLTLRSRLADFLPDFPNARGITIRQLVEHTAGVAHTNRLDWMEMSNAMTLDEIVTGLASEALLFKPGLDTQYSNGGYALLAKVIEVASGMNYRDFIEQEFASAGYPSIGDEAAKETVPDMATRYAPGPEYGQRIAAQTYVTANRIGGGSLYANAEDIFRFFRDSFTGALLSTETTQNIFARPADGDITITGRSPGALAQIYLDFENDLIVVTLSSNSAWPGSLNDDIVSLYRGENVELLPAMRAENALAPHELNTFAGNFRMQQFGWDVVVEPHNADLIFKQGEISTAFVRTTDNLFHLPIYDWLCQFSAYNTEFECRQRSTKSDARFFFERI
ncbi:MAG: serine hydrolase domain-containing protein [Woeseiaceae bacterium]